MSTLFDIQSISHQLAGIAYHEDKTGNKTTCFIDGALPNERVEAKRIDKKKSPARQKQVEHWQAVTILEASPARITPDCQWAEQCGGCQAAHIKHDDQIRFKQDTLIDQLSHAVGDQSIQILPTIKSQTWHYRRRARLAYQYQSRSRKASLGFRERKSASIVNVDQCIALEASLSQLISPLRVFCESSLDDPSAIGHIELINPTQIHGVSKPVVLLRLVKPLVDRDLQKLTDLAGQNKIRLFAQQPEAKTEGDFVADANQVFEVVQGQYAKTPSSIHYQLTSGLNIAFTPLDFIQANAKVNDKMIHLVMEQMALSESSYVFEFFSGVGNFTLPLASTGAKVTSFELVKSSVEKAQYNAQQAGFDKVACHQIDLTNQANMKRLLKEGCDLVFLDPPRTGAAELLEFLPATKAKQIVYVSCNPTTLSRDARQLKALGYQLTSAGLIDMFPNTPHAEAIAVFKRQSNVGFSSDTSKKKVKKKRGGKNVFGF